MYFWYSSLLFFFFKQKTAYEMRISDWSSDVCSSDLTALIAWAVMPFDEGWVISDINVGILYLFAISSLGVYGIIIAGWASNSKYAFLGALRSAAQKIGRASCRERVCQYV